MVLQASSSAMMRSTEPAVHACVWLFDDNLRPARASATPLVAKDPRRVLLGAVLYRLLSTRGRHRRRQRQARPMLAAQKHAVTVPLVVCVQVFAPLFRIRRATTWPPRPSSAPWNVWACTTSMRPTNRSPTRGAIARSFRSRRVAFPVSCPTALFLRALRLRSGLQPSRNCHRCHLSILPATRQDPQPKKRQQNPPRPPIEETAG